MSAKARAQRRDRARVRAEALERAGWRCEAADLVPEVRCASRPGRGPLEVDERAARGVRPGSHLDPDLVQVLCPAHHDWRHAHPLEAEARGLRERGR